MNSNLSAVQMGRGRASAKWAWPLVFVLLLPLAAGAQFSSGSTGADGELNPTENITIDMADHPDGIYHYTSVTIPSGVTVSFASNLNNTPVVWLVQGNCTINGIMSISGGRAADRFGARGGPGGFAGGNGSLATNVRATAGQGPGGGQVTADEGWVGGNASYRTTGNQWGGGQYPAGSPYGNAFLLPLIGGSGGSGAEYSPFRGGSGGGGAMLIASSGEIVLSGGILALGEVTQGSFSSSFVGGAGSGGAVRLIANRISGSGTLGVLGGHTNASAGYTSAGSGYARIEAFDDRFTGTGATHRGMQSIIFLPENATPHLRITKVAGIDVPTNPTGAAVTPDVVIPGSYTNPMTIEVHCEKIPANTPITVEVKPYGGANVSAVAMNSGTYASSSAVVSVAVPRGGGTITAKAVSGVAPGKQVAKADLKDLSVWDTGLAANGERFASYEVADVLGGPKSLVYVTESGERVPFGSGN